MAGIQDFAIFDSNPFKLHGTFKIDPNGPQAVRMFKIGKSDFLVILDKYKNVIGGEWPVDQKTWSKLYFTKKEGLTELQRV